jgi:hypothetical protein
MAMNNLASTHVSDVQALYGRVLEIRRRMFREESEDALTVGSILTDLKGTSAAGLGSG